MTVIAPDDDGQRIDRWLKKHFPTLGFGQVQKLLRTGQEIVAVNFRAFEVYIAVALVYLVMTMSIAKALKILETRLINKTSGKSA